MSKINPYFVLSNSSGKFHRRGFLKDLPENIIELLEEGSLCSLWDIKENNPDELIDNLPYGHHPSFAFSSCNELCLGDYV